MARKTIVMIINSDGITSIEGKVSIPHFQNPPGMENIKSRSTSSSVK